MPHKTLRRKVRTAAEMPDALNEKHVGGWSGGQGAVGVKVLPCISNTSNRGKGHIFAFRSYRNEPWNKLTAIGATTVVMFLISVIAAVFVGTLFFLIKFFLSFNTYVSSNDT